MSARLEPRTITRRWICESKSTKGVQFSPMRTFLANTGFNEHQLIACAGYLRYLFEKSLVEWSVRGISIEDFIIFGEAEAGK